jgi:hypothetical protein
MPHINHILLIGSGGCTALSIATRFPEPNRSQIDLIKRKVQALRMAEAKPIVEAHRDPVHDIYL